MPPRSNEEAGLGRRPARGNYREGLRASFVDPFRPQIPVRILAKIAVPADEDRAGFLVAFERPQEPVRRDVGELAAAGIESTSRFDRRCAARRRTPARG